jgi:sugar lactone lactonase YvrE
MTRPIQPLDLSTLTRLGAGLRRPERVAVTAGGEIFVSHAPAEGAVGVAKIAADGRVSVIEARDGPLDLLPNGWSMDPEGGFLLANLGDSGGVWRLGADGACTPVLTTIEGLAMPPVNFVHRAEDGVLWISVSTWRVPRDRALHRDVADGFVIRMDAADRPETARIVADGLGYANEVKVDPTGGSLYVNETMARRLSRYPITGTGLGPRETVVDYIDGIIPDGFEFDAEGGIWCASVMSNRLIRVLPDGHQTLMLDDSDPDEVAAGMSHWREGMFSRADLNIGAGRPFGNIASVTFGGPDLKTLYLGSLFGEALLVAPSPVAGAEPPHWRFPART